MTYRGGSKPRPIEDRIAKKIDFDALDGCWLWTAKVYEGVNAGYATIWNGSRMEPAHRVVWRLFVGPIPDGMTIDHLCRVRHCVNPDHLEVTTHQENILRGTNGAAQNSRKTHCFMGHPFDEDNTILTSQGKRQCRICTRRRNRAYYHQQRGKS